MIFIRIFSLLGYFFVEIDYLVICNYVSSCKFELKVLLLYEKLIRVQHEILTSAQHEILISARSFKLISKQV